MVEQKSITWEQAAVELFGKTYIQNVPNVRTIKHIILDFASTSVLLREKDFL